MDRPSLAAPRSVRHDARAMRVMFLSASGQLGGAETSLLEILASLRQAEPSWPLLLLAAAEGPLNQRAAALGVNTVTLPFPQSIARLGESGAAASGGWAGFAARLLMAVPSAATYLGRMRAAIRDFEPDVLHSNGFKMHVLGAFARPAPPLVWHAHDYLGSRALSARLLRWNRARCTAVVANSASVAADVQRVLRDVTVVAVRNAVDVTRFSPVGPGLDLDAVAGLTPAAPDTVRVGLLGTFARWKGHATFLQAVARVPRTIPIRAYIIGGPVYETQGSQYSREELMTLVRDLNIGDRVGFTGVVTEPDAALRALDIVVHASTQPEPFGLVIAEAMACERAVIVSAAGGAAELFTDNVDAVGHTPGDVDGLSSRITALATDAAWRGRIAHAARATAVRSFDRTRLAAELAPIYREIAGRRR
jgi:glycosyltransferase involved in cell wall biosynthesis